MQIFKVRSFSQKLCTQLPFLRPKLLHLLHLGPQVTHNPAKHSVDVAPTRNPTHSLKPPFIIVRIPGTPPIPFALSRPLPPLPALVRPTLLPLPPCCCYYDCCRLSALLPPVPPSHEAYQSGTSTPCSIRRGTHQPHSNALSFVCQTKRHQFALRSSSLPGVRLRLSVAVSEAPHLNRRSTVAFTPTTSDLHAKCNGVLPPPLSAMLTTAPRRKRASAALVEPLMAAI